MITNTRETGKLEVMKDLNPTTDDPASSTSRSTAPPTPDATNVGDGGTTGEETLEHRQPHGRGDRRHRHGPGRLHEVDRAAGPTTAPAPWLDLATTPGR